MTTPKLLSEEEMREGLKYIVTRGGMSARIPEMLELELDDLLKLVSQQKQLYVNEMLDEIRQAKPLTTVDSAVNLWEQRIEKIAERTRNNQGKAE